MTRPLTEIVGEARPPFVDVRAAPQFTRQETSRKSGGKSDVNDVISCHTPLLQYSHRSDILLVATATAMLEQ